MAKFIVRRLSLMLLTMFLVSIAVFAITEAAPGNVARNVLGIQITPEQEASFLAQQGLDKPIYERYLSWLAGTDWRAANRVGLPVRRLVTDDGFTEWWAVAEDGSLLRWTLNGEDLIVRKRLPDGTVVEEVDNERWQVNDPAQELVRLQAVRDAVQANDQLTEADRQAILDPLDRILGILRDAGGADQAALKERLAGPEAELEALINPEARERQAAFQDAAEEVVRQSGLLAVIDVLDTLSGEGAEALELGNLQALARSLDKGANALEDHDPAAAARVREAAEALRANDRVAARETLADVVPAVDRLTASLATFFSALEAGMYQQAAGVLRTLGDPAQVSFGPEQLDVVPSLLDQAGQAIEAGNPELGAALGTAADQLAEGAEAEARAALTVAADRLVEVGYAITLSDAAARARVARSFWGIDTQNHAVRWEKGTGEDVWTFIVGTGWKSFTGGPAEYIPLQKGLLRGDPGVSLRTGRPVSDLLFVRLRNSLVLAGIAFAIVMPLALVLGLIAGLREGSVLDRVLSIGGMMFSVTPEFATGIFLILIFAFWLGWVPGATVFGEDAPWTRPDMLVLPVATLTLIELGYVLRITRASMVEVMKAPYIRTAFLKGLPYWRVVTRHAIRNALMAPITVIMLHVNWLLGGIVVVEVIFGYPGLGSYLLDSALFKDFNAIEAGAIILVAVAVGTQLLADILYTFLNPRIRYA